MVDFIMAVRSVKDWSYGIGTPTEENSFVVLDQNELPQGLEFYKKEEYHAWHFFTIEEIISLLIDTIFILTIRYLWKNLLEFLVGIKVITLIGY